MLEIDRGVTQIAPPCSYTSVMGLKSETRTIGNHDYTVTTLGAGAGKEVLRRLAKIVGSAVLVGGPAALKTNEGVVTGALAMVSDLSESDLDYFCKAFGPSSTVNIDGKTPRVSDVFDMHFSGEYFELTMWLAFCVEVNFASFFHVAKAKLEGRVAPATETTKSPPSP